MSMTGPSLRGAVDLSALTRKAAVAATGHNPDESMPAAMPLIFVATDANFATVLEISRRVPVVVDLWAEWCGPCKQLTPILERLVTEYAGRLLLATVDVDANPQLASAFAAQSIPTVAAVLAGQPVPLFTGAIPEPQVRAVFERLLEVANENGINGRIPVASSDETAPAAGAGDSTLPAVPDLPPRHQAAFDAIERGDYEAAAAEYRAAIAQNPRDADAVAGLAQVNLLGRLQGHRLADIRQAAAQNPNDLGAQMAVADLDLSGGHIDDAFERLLEVFRTADAADRNQIRERLLELFDVVGTADPRVSRARSRLASLLY